MVVLGRTVMYSAFIQRSRRDGKKTGAILLIVVGALVVCLTAVEKAPAIDVTLTMEEAKAEMEAGRNPMEKANTAEEVKQIMERASLLSRIGANPVKDPCGPSAILRTKRFWLQAFGRKEAVESKKQKRKIRMPDAKLRKLLNTPQLEIEVQLCGDDQYFAEGAEVVFQQHSKNIRPIDVSPAQKGRKNTGSGPGYRSRFTARFSYESFNPMAKTKVVVFFLDGKLIEIPADFSKIR